MNYPQITLQKSACLFFVIVGHALLPFTSPAPFWTLYADTQAFGGDFLAAVLRSALVPSFIFASGFLLENTLQTREPSFGDMLGGRIKRLLVPWLLLMLFWLVPLYTLFDIPAYQRPAASSLLETYAAGLQGRFTEHTWFLLVLFWATLFWLLFRPLVQRAQRLSLPPLPKCLSGGITLDDIEQVARPQLEKLKEKAAKEMPSWVNPGWFALEGEKPAVTLADLAGMGLALAAALAVELCAQNLTWFCLWETSGPILFLYCGMLTYRHREWLDAFLWKNFLKVFPALALAFLLLLPAFGTHFLVSWILGVLGALLTYSLSLASVRFGFPAKKDKGWRAYFRTNMFRFYLFHMPTMLLVFMALNHLEKLSPWLCILATVILALAATTLIVWCSRKLEQTQLPKIAAGMRPGA